MKKIKQDLYLLWQWTKIHRDIGLWPDLAEFNKIRQAYEEDGRHYHTLQHIYECIRFVNRHYGSHPWVVFALFYHDIVYDVTRKDNEEASAQRWIQYAKSRDLHTHAYLKMNLVTELIRMTAKHKVEQGQGLDFEIMNDADMHVFLCPDHHYLEYARNIWLEYCQFGREGYLAGRLSFLSTVDPKTIFYTHQARRLVHHAVANLDLERTILEQHPETIMGSI